MAKILMKIMVLLNGLFIAAEAASQVSCPVSLPQHSSSSCRLAREKQLARQRAIYQIKPPTPGGLKPPLLKMTTDRLKQVLGQDAFAKHHLQLYERMVDYNKKLFNIWTTVNSGTAIKKIDDYKKIFDFFFLRQEPFGGKQFRTPSTQEPFSDVINQWNSDKVFAEQRLAGLNAMSLERVYFEKVRCSGDSCGHGQCLGNGRCRCDRGYTGPNAKMTSWPIIREADDCKTRCKFGNLCPKNIPSRKQGLKYSDLKWLLNPKFNWNNAVKKALGTQDTLESAISKGYVYALDYPLCDTLPDVFPDVTETDPNRTVKPFNSPVALFVSKSSTSESVFYDGKTSTKKQTLKGQDIPGNDFLKDDNPDIELEKDGKGLPFRHTETVKEWKKRFPNMEDEDHVKAIHKESSLIPVAIQMDYLQNSAVHTPEDGDLWTLAKLNVQVADYGYNQIVENLLKTHLLMEPFCVVLPRQLSADHPLHEILKFHCRGIMVSNTFVAPNLLNPFKSTHLLMGFGHKGSKQLVNTGYLESGWHDTDFKNNIKKRGLDDRHSLPYFPYRDDGEVLYDAIEEMVQDYVYAYYLNDGDIKQDTELQNYVNEISADGKGPNGGNGMLKGFPAKVTTREGLVNIITRLISQLTIQHAAVNYPLIDYGAYTPLTPTKLYNDISVPEGHFSVLNLPNAKTSAIQASLSMNLATFRYDTLFDYSGELRDKKGGVVVDKHFRRLRQQIQPYLEDVNKQRYQRGHLTYPYMLPRWLPNGVQT